MTYQRNTRDGDGGDDLQSTLMFVSKGHEVLTEGMRFKAYDRRTYITPVILFSPGSIFFAQPIKENMILRMRPAEIKSILIEAESA